MHKNFNGGEFEEYSSSTNNFQTRVPQMMSTPGPTIPKTATKYSIPNHDQLPNFRFLISKSKLNIKMSINLSNWCITHNWYVLSAVSLRRCSILFQDINPIVNKVGKLGGMAQFLTL